MSSDKQTSNQHDEASPLEIDISTLASLIASTTMITTNGDSTGDSGAEEPSGELGIEELKELMNRIEAANDIADGVEDRLNGILEHLDGLLCSLETRGEAEENRGAKDTGARDLADNP